MKYKKVYRPGYFVVLRYRYVFMTFGRNTVSRTMCIGAGTELGKQNQLNSAHKKLIGCIWKYHYRTNRFWNGVEE